MTDTTQERIPLSELRTPEQEMVEEGAGVPAAAELSLEQHHDIEDLIDAIGHQDPAAD